MIGVVRSMPGADETKATERLVEQPVGRTDELFFRLSACEFQREPRRVQRALLGRRDPQHGGDADHQRVTADVNTGSSAVLDVSPLVVHELVGVVS